jgi:hypothetical protein
MTLFVQIEDEMGRASKIIANSVAESSQTTSSLTDVGFLSIGAVCQDPTVQSRVSI